MSIYKNFNRYKKIKNGFELRNKFNLNEKLQFAFKSNNATIRHLVGNVEILQNVLIPKNANLKGALMAIQNRYCKLYGNELIDWE